MPVIAATMTSAFRRSGKNSRQEHRTPAAKAELIINEQRYACRHTLIRVERASADGSGAARNIIFRSWLGSRIVQRQLPVVANCKSYWKLFYHR
jgi:hypothetical protein